MKIYDTFNDEPEKMPQMEEIDITVRDLSPGNEKYCSKYVRAILSKDADALPDGDELMIRFQRGGLLPEKWRIKIIKEIGEYKITETALRT
jgi:hypothetical protein